MFDEKWKDLDGPVVALDIEGSLRELFHLNPSEYCAWSAHTIEFEYKGCVRPEVQDSEFHARVLRKGGEVGFILDVPCKNYLNRWTKVGTNLVIEPLVWVELPEYPLGVCVTIYVTVGWFGSLSPEYLAALQEAREESDGPVYAVPWEGTWMAWTKRIPGSVLVHMECLDSVRRFEDTLSPDDSDSDSESR